MRGRHHLQARDPAVLSVLFGFPLFFFVVLCFCLFFLGFQGLWFSTSGSLDRGVTVGPYKDLISYNKLRNTYKKLRNAYKGLTQTYSRGTETRT